MGVAGGPKISKDGLVLAIDSDSNIRGYTKYGTSGTNNNHRAIRNLVDRSSTFSTANTSQLTGGVTYYTLYGITYPEGNYSPANRDGITPGFENISASKTYDCSRDFNYFVFDEDTNTWISDSYFNGLRINGHCYDTYSSTNRATEHAAFQADYDNIKNAFPNATHIVIGSHASENVDNDADTVTRLKEIGFPDDAVGLGRVEFILVGKVGKPWTHHYVRENVSSAVANMVIGLPLEGKGGALTFDGTDDSIDLPNDLGYDNEVSIFAVFKSNGTPAGGYHIICGGQELEISIPTAGQLRTGIYTTSRYVNNLGSGLTDGNYHHIGFTFSNNTKTAYIDGVSVGTQSTSGNLTNSFSNRTLGRFGSSSSYYLNGELPVFKVYNRALSADEVQQNYSAYKNRFNL